MPYGPNEVGVIMTHDPPNRRDYAHILLASYLITNAIMSIEQYRRITKVLHTCGCIDTKAYYHIRRQDPTWILPEWNKEVVVFEKNETSHTDRLHTLLAAQRELDDEEDTRRRIFAGRNSDEDIPVPDAVKSHPGDLPATLAHRHQYGRYGWHVMFQLPEIPDVLATHGYKIEDMALVLKMLYHESLITEQTYHQLLSEADAEAAKPK